MWNTRWKRVGNGPQVSVQGIEIEANKNHHGGKSCSNENDDSRLLFETLVQSRRARGAAEVWKDMPSKNSQ
jgi:hypothetical protein